MTTTEEMLQDQPPNSRRRVRSTRRLIAIWALVAVALLIVAGVIYIVQGSHGYYTFSPGSAPVVSDQSSCHSVGGGSFALPGGKPCVRIELPASKAASLDGSIMMVDVLVGPSTPIDFLLSKLGLLHRFRDGSQLVPSSEYLGTTPASQVACQGTQQMVGAQQAASVVALRRLGYTVTENDQGAQIYQVGPGTPAESAGIKCNDLITAVNGTPVHSATDLVNDIHALAPGDTVHLTAERTGQNGKNQTVQLTAKLSGTPAENGQAADPSRAFLGVVAQTLSSFTFPFNLDVQVGDIGGPSAGLALTLGIMDSLTGGTLTGGLHVAATGTMDLQGDVGDVGGVAQKTVAVRHAGAQVFFVPVQELATAKSEAGSMKVYAVSSLTQTLDILQSLGGHVPAQVAGQTGSG